MTKKVSKRAVGILLAVATCVVSAIPGVTKAYYPASAYNFPPYNSCVESTDHTGSLWAAEKLITEAYNTQDSQLGDSISPTLLYQSAGITASLDNVDRTEGCNSLTIEASFNNWVETKGVSRLHTPDLSFQPYGVSLDIKVTAGFNDQLSFRFVEDNNRNGSYDGTDEVWGADITPTNPGSWEHIVVPYDSMTRLAGSGDNILNLDKLGMSEIMIVNSSATTHTATVKVDNFRQLVAGPIAQQDGKLRGTFIQLDAAGNGYNCNDCLDWTTTQWVNELTRMKNIQIDTLILQDVAYISNPSNTSGGIALLDGLNLPWVNTTHPTVDRIVAAAEQVGIKIVFSNLWIPEVTYDKCDVTHYANVYTKSKDIVDEIWRRFGNSPAFRGWYISQEVDDYYDATCSKPAFITSVSGYYKNMSDYMRTKDSKAPIFIAPSVTASSSLSDFSDIWQQILSATPALDTIILQDGRGQLRTDQDVDVIQYGTTLATISKSLGKTFGFTLETFTTLNPETIATTYPAAPINQLRGQIRFAAPISDQLYNFHWYNMTSKYSGGDQLYADYGQYVASVYPVSGGAQVGATGTLAKTGDSVYVSIFASIGLVGLGYIIKRNYV